MKQVFFAILLIISSIVEINSQSGYEITVDITNLNNKTVELLVQKDHTGKPVIYSPESIGTVLSFKGMVESPTFANLKVGGKSTPIFAISNTIIKIALDANYPEKVTVSGGSQQLSLIAYNSQIEPLNLEVRRLYDTMKVIDKESAVYTDLINKRANLGKEIEVFQIKFIENNPASVMSPKALWFIYGDIKEEEAIRLFRLLDPSLKEHPHYKYVARSIEAWDRNRVGSLVPDMKQKSIDSTLVSLSDFRGKYLLLDFWASWCVPCRASNPELVAIYQKFGGKQFEILGISLDKDFNSWKAAIEKDGLTWRHVSDLKYWDNAISRYFGINSIPNAILIDPDGKIVAKNLHGKELEKLLEEKIKLN